jgi:hypothetical protein
VVELDRSLHLLEISIKKDYTSMSSTNVMLSCVLKFDIRRNFSRRGPEARLYLACFAAIMIPVGMFIYAWSAFQRIPWIALAIGITIFTWGIFIVYLAVFSYLADWYVSLSFEVSYLDVNGK